MYQANTRVLSFLQFFVNAVTLITISAGLAGLAGWVFDNSFLRSILPNTSPIKFNTAICFLCAGTSLWFLKDAANRSRQKRIGQLFAIAVLIIASLSLSEYLFRWDLGIDQLLVRDLTAFPGSVPGRMSPVTAVSLTMGSLALLRIGSKLSQYFSLGILSLAMVAVVGYIFNYQSLYQLPGYGSTALLTAVGLLGIGFGILATRPKLGIMGLMTANTPAGRTVRLLFPVTVLLILLLGFMVERGEQLGLIEIGHKSVILIVLLILIYCPLIYFYAHRINRSELEIIRLSRLYATLSQINQTIVRVHNRDELYQTICNVAVQFGGFAVAWIGLSDEASGDIQPVVVNGLDVHEWPFPVVNIHSGHMQAGLVATAIRTSQIVTSEDIQLDQRVENLHFQLEAYDYRSSAVVPFRLRGRTIGVVGLVSNEVGLFKAETEIHLLEELGLDISFALDAMETEQEREQAEQQLLFYASMVASANDAILSKTLDGIILTWNPGAERLYGYSASEVIGKPLTFLLPPDRSNDVASILESIKTGQRVEHYETIRLTKDGRRVDVSLTVSPIIDDEGQIVGASSMARDITRRKQVDEQLQRQNKRLRVLREIDTAILAADSLENIVSAALSHTLELINCHRVVMVLIDRETNELMVFDVKTSGDTSIPKGTRIPLLSFQDRFKNLSENQPVLLNDLDVLPDLPPLLQTLRQEGLRSACLLPLYSQGGLIGAFNMSSEIPNFFDEERISLGREVASQVAIALTQMYLIEDLRESEEKYRAFFENSLDAILLAAPDGGIQAANPAACRMFGRTEAEIRALSRDRLVDQSDPRLVMMLEESTKTGKTFGELTMFRKDGSPFPVELSSVLFNDRQGNTRMSMLIRDITERKRTEEMLRESQQKFSILFEKSSFAISLSRLPEGVIVNINEAFEKAFGYSKEEVIGKTSLELGINPDTEGRMRLLASLKEDGSTRNQELALLTKSGEVRIFSVNIDPVKINGQKYILNTSQDITEQKQAKARVSYQARLLENINDAVLATDADFNLTSWNHAAEEMYGYKADEVLGSKVQDIIDSEFTDSQRAEAYEVLTQGDSYRTEVVQYHRDGHSFWVEGSTFVLKEATGEISGYVSINRDITPRKQAEERVQRQLKYLNSLRLIDRAIISSFDLDVILDVLLQQALDQLEVDASALLLFNAHQQTLDYAASRGFRSEALQYTNLKPGEGYASQAVLSRKTFHITGLMETEGKLAKALQRAHEDFMDYYGTPLIVKGEVKGVLEIYHRSPLKADTEWLDFLETLAGQAAIAIDNSQLFENLQHLNMALEERVVQRTAELQDANAELERANRAKDEFLANMSHELRTPLTSILGLSESLLEQRRDPLTDHQQKSIEIIESSGRHLLELINDILDLSKIEAGKFDFYPQPVIVDDICRSSLSFIRTQAVKKSITVTYYNEATLPRILADPRRLKQILVNLLTNAVKFTAESGEVILQVNDDLEQDLIQFSVIDNGIGVAPNDLERLFQPFVQVDSSLNRQYEGTGLGLALSQKLTDLHGGSIEVESEVGKGSRFTINLPCNQAELAKLEQSQVQPASQDAPAPLRELSGDKPVSHAVILLAEDNPANILTIGEYLESYGYKVVVAHDGLEAIEKAESIRPDLILMDVQMPSMNGLEAIAHLRGKQQFEHTPIISLTALAMPGDRERSLLAGASEYMSKPVSLKTLREQITKLLQNPSGS